MEKQACKILRLFGLKEVRILYQRCSNLNAKNFGKALRDPLQQPTLGWLLNMQMDRLQQARSFEKGKGKW